MPRWSLFLVFFLVAGLILGAVHFYLYRRLVVAPGLPAGWTKGLGWALAGLALSFPVSFLLGRRLGLGPGRLVMLPGYVWLGIMMLLLTVVVGVDLLRALLWLGARATGHESPLASPGRRRLLARAAAVVAIAGVGGATALALWLGLGRLVIKRVAVVLPRLPASLDGFTIALLSDLHLGVMRSGRWVREVVARTNELGADLIAIAGDLADATPAQLQGESVMLGELRARHGVFFVTGNHEYFVDLHGWLARLRELDIRVLRNERVQIGRAGASFDLCGIDDHDGARFARDHGANVAEALRGRDPDRAVVLLAHQPRAVFEAAKHQVGLVLCGHTHGGQVWPWRYLVYLQQPYVSGLHDYRGTQIYVSEGTGFWGPPMRLGSAAEITLVTLHAPRPRSPGA
jgi:predicted MPP superfamily phosphohydrolase